MSSHMTGPPERGGRPPLPATQHTHTEFSFYLFAYFLAALHGLRDPSSPTWDQTRAPPPAAESMESSPQDGQGSPYSLCQQSGGSAPPPSSTRVPSLFPTSCRASHCPRGKPSVQVSKPSPILVVLDCARCGMQGPRLRHTPQSARSFPRPARG